MLIILAIAMRLMLIANSWPLTSSEEGTFGLEAMHIAYRRGAFPIFMYGQNYMGTLEAYFGACFFHLFGVSIFSLRLGMLTFFALFLLCQYYLTKLLYSPKMALITLAVLCFGAEGVLTPEMMVLGGTTETLLLGTLLLLLATHLSLSSGQVQSARHRWLRLAGFAAWGCCTICSGK
jgi:4-amino-4-deoxy-L-arabinose transferase-like glycosyltransferase